MGRTRRSRWQFGVLLGITVGMVLLLGAGRTVGQSVSPRSFSDIQAHWAQPCITSLATQRILNGYPDGRFRPDQPVTRAEFATIIDAAFAPPPRRSPVSFRDVPSTSWAAPAIQAVTRGGWMAGYGDRRFGDRDPITRIQMLVALGMGLSDSDETGSSLPDFANWFEDSTAIPAYATPGLSRALQSGVVVNYPQRSRLQPNRAATRADVAAAVCQAQVQVQPAAPSMIPSQYVVTWADRRGDGVHEAPPDAQSDRDPEPMSELRGVWLTNIDSDVLFDRDRLQTAIYELADLNFTTLFPTVWNWGYTLYPSRVAAQATGIALDPEPGLQNRDMLAEVVATAHEVGLTVMPWVEFGLMAPADSELAARHPDWLTQRRDGSQIVLRGADQRVWLNPMHPAVQDFLVNLLAEIAGTYDVDGIQLDDHFGLPIDLGYDPYTVTLYRHTHDGQLPPIDETDPDWMRWRSRYLTRLMARIFAAVKDVNPDCVISLAPNPQPFAYDTSLQAWDRWEQQGLVEELIVQVYRPDRDRFVQELNHPVINRARQHIPVGIGILSGLKGRPVPMQWIAEQVRLTRQGGYAGASFFFYETLWVGEAESRTERKAHLRSLFATPAQHPTLRSGWQPTR